jgi:hypothetical protein
MWLQLHMHQIVGVDLNTRLFPSSNHHEGEPQATTIAPSVYTWPFTPTTIAQPTFNSWWQEFHDHIFSEPVHLFCIELMPDFQPASEVI